MAEGRKFISEVPGVPDDFGPISAYVVIATQLGCLAEEDARDHRIGGIFEVRKVPEVDMPDDIREKLKGLLLPVRFMSVPSLQEDGIAKIPHYDMILSSMVYKSYDLFNYFNDCFESNGEYVASFRQEDGEVMKLMEGPMSSVDYYGSKIERFTRALIDARLGW